MIDGAGARVDLEWLEGVSDIYHLGMTLDSGLQLKNGSAGRDTKRTFAVDPPLRRPPSSISY
jgi:hypothetical protein